MEIDSGGYLRPLDLNAFRNTLDRVAGALGYFDAIDYNDTCFTHPAEVQARIKDLKYQGDAP